MGLSCHAGRITLTWVLYKLYLPLLLVELGLAEELAVTLLIVENALETLIEPIFGALSDRQQQAFGTRVPIISIGAILSSALFIAIPILIIFSHERNFSQWLFIGLTITWASVMAIFRSPAMALLGRSASTELLPQAASLLTLVGGIVGAFRFDAYGWIVKFVVLGLAALPAGKIGSQLGNSTAMMIGGWGTVIVLLTLLLLPNGLVRVAMLVFLVLLLSLILIN